MAHHLSFLFCLILSLVLFRVPLAILLNSSLSDERYSHVFFILLISVCLIYFRRGRVYKESRFCFWGVPALLLGIALYWIFQRPQLFSDGNDYLSGSVFAILLTWVAAFFLCYGLKPLRAARFPLCFLLLMIPMPTFLLGPVVGALQRGSADATRVLFRIFGVPAVWQGLDFSLRDYRFEIAVECSGIRSCLVLFVTSILAGHLFLRSIWAKVCLSLFTIFVAIFKNGVRIATVTYLTSYVDKSYYDSWVHRNGGAPFSLVALAILVPLLLALQKAERHGRRIDGDQAKA
jgi:exosortase